MVDSWAFGPLLLNQGLLLSVPQNWFPLLAVNVKNQEEIF